MCLWIRVPFACDLREFGPKMESQHFLESNFGLLRYFENDKRVLAKPEVMMIKQNADTWGRMHPLHGDT